MWFKNLKIYRITSEWPLQGHALEEALAKDAFVRGGSLSMESHGWVSPRENDQLAHTVGGQILLTLRSEKKLLPASVIKQVTKERALEFEEQHGYKPGRKVLKDIKTQVTDELLLKSHTVYRDTRVWVDPKNRWLVIDTSSRSRADDVIAKLASLVDPLPLTFLRVATTPAAAMTQWLATEEAPEGFSIDQDAELRTPDESRATVRYVRHFIDGEDVRRHIEQGKQATRLAMTWNDRISFMLTDALDIKRVTPLDVLKENPDASEPVDADERFDADFTLMTAELAALLTDLVDALGGELEEEAQATDKTTHASDEDQASHGEA